jgi:hypothetical protein
MGPDSLAPSTVDPHQVRINDRAVSLRLLLLQERARRDLRAILTSHIAQQSVTDGGRCPLTQIKLFHHNSVLLKLHSPEPTWVVISGEAYDTVLEYGTLDEIGAETHYRVEVIDGRAI